jgi:glycosyltransferase involved in cell wall biosynthesis
MSEVLDLTIAIPVRNEEKNLPGCLAAIGAGLARRIVVLDSGSTDNTQSIAEGFGAEVVNFKWDGKFPKKRNWFLRNGTLTTKWILFIDADEYLTESFKNELRESLSRDNKVGYWLSYTIYFLGKQLKGGYPLRKLALFRVGAGEYERIEEDNWSNLDMEVHEHPILEGEVGVIRSRIDHQDFRGVSHYVTKHNEYASWEAGRFIKTAGDPAISSKWTLKQRLKYRLMRSILIGPAYFCGSFLLLGGFRDGARGWAFAVLKMSYFTQVYCKIRESKNLLK